MRVLKNEGDQPGPAIDASRISEIMALSRVWLGIGDASRPRHLLELSPERVLQALQAGDHVLWRGWTLRTLPPRRIGPRKQTPEWATGILAVSTQGLLSELRLDAEGVHRLCQRMLDLEERQVRAGKNEDQDSELEDGGLSRQP